MALIGLIVVLLVFVGFYSLLVMHIRMSLNLLSQLIMTLV